MSTPITYPKRVEAILEQANGFTREEFLYLAHAALDQGTAREDVVTARPAFKAIELLIDLPEGSI